MSSSLTEQVEVAPRRHSPSTGTEDVGAVVAKAKKAAASLWMILHAQVSDEQSLCLYVCCIRSVSISPVSMWLPSTDVLMCSYIFYSARYPHICTTHRTAALAPIDVPTRDVPIPSASCCTSKLVPWHHRRQEEVGTCTDARKRAATRPGSFSITTSAAATRGHSRRRSPRRPSRTFAWCARSWPGMPRRSSTRRAKRSAPT